MNSNQFFLNPTSKLVKGPTRSILCDLGKNEYYLIPSILHIILEDRKMNSIDDVYKKYCSTSEDYKIIDEYFQFLIEFEQITFSNNRQFYINISTDYDYPGFISNAIIDIDKSDITNVLKFIDQCEQIYCRSLQIRYFNLFDWTSIKEIILHSQYSILEWIEFYFPDSNDLDLTEIISVLNMNQRIKLIAIYGSKEDKIIYENENGTSKIITIHETISDHRHCGVIGKNYFSSNIKLFSESVSNNSCLNQKISMDVHGDIKNCPSMSKSFGNIKNTSLLDAMTMPGFKKYWTISKDKISICKDCEFRYICTDCRAYIEDPNDIYSKPLKCGYNPYLGEWTEWSTNPLKRKAIKYYKMENVVARRKLLLDVNTNKNA